MECTARPSPQLRCPLCFDPAPVHGGYACPTCNSRLHTACAHDIGRCHPEAAPYCEPVVEDPSPGPADVQPAGGWAWLLSAHLCLVGLTCLIGGGTILANTANCLPAFVAFHVLGAFSGRQSLHAMATGYAENLDLSGDVYSDREQPLAYALSLLFYLACAAILHGLALYMVMRSMGQG